MEIFKFKVFAVFFPYPFFCHMLFIDHQQASLSKSENIKIIFLKVKVIYVVLFIDELLNTFLRGHFLFAILPGKWYLPLTVSDE